MACRYQIVGQDTWLDENEFKSKLSEGLLDKFIIDNNLSIPTLKGFKVDVNAAESFKMEQPTATERTMPATEEVKAENKFQTLADKIRTAKLTPGTLTGGETGTLSANNFEGAWNSAVEVAAKTVEVAGQTVESIEKAIRAAERNFKNSDFYKNLSDRSEKSRYLRDFRSGIKQTLEDGKMTSAEKRSAKEFGDKVKEATGQAKETKEIMMTKTEGLKKQLMDKLAGAKDAVKAIQEMKTQIRDFIRTNLPKDSYTTSQVNSLINAVSKAKTQASLNSAIDRVNSVVAAKYEQIRKRTATEIKNKVRNKKTLLAKVNNKWKGKITVEAQKEFKEFVNSGALDDLDNRTQQELDSINDILDGIVNEGKADFKSVKTAEDTRRRTENATLLEGLAGKDYTELKGMEAIQELLDRGGSVIIDGQSYNKSSFAEWSKTASIDSKGNIVKSNKEEKRKEIEAKQEEMDKAHEEGLRKLDELEASGLTDEEINKNPEFLSIIGKKWNLADEIFNLKQELNALESNKEQKRKEIDDKEHEVANAQEKWLDKLDELESNGINGIDAFNHPEALSLRNNADALEGELSNLNSQLDALETSNQVTVKGYEARNISAVKDVSRLKESKRKTFDMLNPLKAITDIYTSLKGLYKGSQAVKEWVQKNVEQPIKDAYVNRMTGLNEKINDYNNGLADIFGSKKKALKALSEKATVNPIKEKLKAGQSITNSLMVSLYNLTKIEGGFERLNSKSGVDAEAVVKYIESNPQLKQYADFLINQYESLKSDYEPVYSSYTNMPFPEGVYYPAYASNFEDDFIDLGDVMGADGAFNAMSAVSNNMKQRTNYTGAFNTTMDAHRTFMDYVKSMEHAKSFMPVAKSVNQLFNNANLPYIIEKMGVDAFNDMKTSLSVILSDKPLKGMDTVFGKGLSGLMNFNVIATLGFKPSSILKQFTSFSHFWGAGIKEGINPLQVMAGVPVNMDELKLVADLISSDYMKERFKGGNIDVEIKKIIDNAEKSGVSKAWKNIADIALAPVKVGDASAILFGPGGGSMFAVATYRKQLKNGATPAEAKDYAYRRFIEEAEMTQQSTRPDLTSNIQRDPMFRLMGTYRTGQMASAKKVINGAKLLMSGTNLTTAEKAQAIWDMTYFSALSAFGFSAVASGAIKFYEDQYDDDDRKRMLYDTAMDQVGSDLQGYGLPGFLADWSLNAMRGDAWKNNTPTINFVELMTKSPATIMKMMTTPLDYNSLSREEQVQYLKDLGISEEEEYDRYEEVVDKFKNSNPFSALSQTERNELIKAIGVKNINDLATDFKENFKGDKSFMDALLGYEKDYFKYSKQRGKKDMIFKGLTGEEYSKKKEEEGGVPSEGEGTSVEGSVEGDLNQSVEGSVD